MPRIISTRVNLLLRLIDQGGEDQMNVVWHGNCGVEFVLETMVMPARGENNVASNWRQDPAEFCHKSDEMRGKVSLQVRQIASIELHTGILSSGTAPNLHPPKIFHNQFPKRLM